MSINAELQRIYDGNNRLLRPTDVVQFARENPDSELHERFVWDDAEAGEKYREVQAGYIIRSAKFIVTGGNPIAVRAWVSLPSDRNAEGGYRATLDVLKSPVMVDEMLGAALDELRAFRTKYGHLKELRSVMDAIGHVESANMYKLTTNVPAFVPPATESKRASAAKGAAG